MISPINADVRESLYVTKLGKLGPEDVLTAKTTVRYKKELSTEYYLVYTAAQGKKDSGFLNFYELIKVDPVTGEKTRLQIREGSGQYLGGTMDAGRIDAIDSFENSRVLVTAA